jgi:hypothetical protein
MSNLNGLRGADWAEGVPEFIDGALFDVILKDGQQRQCRRIPTLDWSNLFFTDCTHPAQNSFCADSLISAWRVTPNAKLKGAIDEV